MRRQNINKEGFGEALLQRSQTERHDTVKVSFDRHCQPRDQVTVDFDWKVPQQQNGRIVFKTCISREDKRSSIGFEIDLGRLSEAQLELLRDFLLRHHARCTEVYEVVRTITWLLDLSLAQHQPDLSEDDRQVKVRELLLSRAGQTKS